MLLRRGIPWIPNVILFLVIVSAEMFQRRLGLPWPLGDILAGGLAGIVYVLVYRWTRRMQPRTRARPPEK